MAISTAYVLTHLVRSGFLRSFSSRSEYVGRSVTISHAHDAVCHMSVSGLGQQQQLMDTCEEMIQRLLDDDNLILQPKPMYLCTSRLV